MKNGRTARSSDAAADAGRKCLLSFGPRQKKAVGKQTSYCTEISLTGPSKPEGIRGELAR